MTFKSIFDAHPDFINDEGTKWWKHEDMYRYDVLRDIHLVDYGYKFYAIELTNGQRSFVITRGKYIEYENTSSEAVAVRVDVLKLLIREGLHEQDGKKLFDT